MDANAIRANESDYRAIKWPPPGPYWCSGYLCGEVGAAIVIAFIPLDDSTPARDRCVLAEKTILEFWPEAKTLGVHGLKLLGSSGAIQSHSAIGLPVRVGGTIFSLSSEIPAGIEN